jgi:1-phosphofructokinase family hexose kinase
MLIAGPNLTMDRTASLPSLRPGEVLRFDRVVVTAGGKGLNVARAARALGHSALLVSLAPGHTGRAAAALIAEEGIELSGVPCAGELRSTMIVQERGGRTTVMNEPGPRVDERRWADYENAVRGRLTSRSVLLCSGSVPPGAPADAYGRLTEIAHAAGARAVVDAAGSTLLRALDAAPDLVTPNLSEAEGSLGLDRGDGTAVESGADARPRAVSAAEALLRQGAKAAVVTADAAGAAVASGGAVEWIPAPRVAEVRNPIGAGDAFLAALAGVWEGGAELLEAARSGAAAGAASVEHPTAGVLDPERARVLAALVSRGG